jgi:type I restriction enzyme S subunit
MSKIDARNGAFGVIVSDLDGAIVTADFPVFNVKKDVVIPQYLFLLSSSKQFAQFAQSCSRGTTNRQRIDVDMFLSQQIPLPSIDEQQRFVDAFENKMTCAINKERQASSLEKDIDEYLLKELGIPNNNGTIDNKHDGFKYMHFVNFAAIERWDYGKTQSSFQCKFKQVKLRNLISSIATGTTPPTSRKDYFIGNIKFYTPGDVTDDMYLSTSERFISESAIIDKKARLFHKNDLLFVAIGSTIGKVGIVSDQVVSSNQQITGFTVKKDMIDVEFLFCYMNYNKNITTAEQSKSTLPIVNQTKILNINVPIPPKHIQKIIVDKIKKIKFQINQLKQTASNLRETAMKEFENKIFENLTDEYYGKTTE